MAGKIGRCTIGFDQKSVDGFACSGGAHAGQTNWCAQNSHGFCMDHRCVCTATGRELLAAIYPHPLSII